MIATCAYEGIHPPDVIGAETFFEMKKTGFLRIASAHSEMSMKFLQYENN